MTAKFSPAIKLIPYIYEKFPFRKGKGSLDVVLGEERGFFKENSWEMRMTAKGDSRDSSEDMFHMFPVVRRFRHDVFPRWIERRCMDVENIFFHHVAGHRSEVAGKNIILFFGVPRGGNLRLGPPGTRFRFPVKSDRLEEDTLFMVSQKGKSKVPNGPSEDLTRVGAVADQVSKTENLIRPGFLDIFQDGLKGLFIGVNIGDNRNAFHRF